jgi:hypothetical protein
MLTTALRRIFIEGLGDEVADPAQWRRKLTIYEHRDAGWTSFSSRTARRFSNARIDVVNLGDL